MNLLNKIKSLFIKRIKVIKEVPVEKRVEIIKEVEKPVEVVKAVVIEKPIEVIREIEVENRAFELVDNQELLVKDKIIQLVNTSNRLDIATGYFYHHGYNLFANSVEALVKRSRTGPTNVPVRMVVGNLGLEDEIDKTTAKLVWRFIQDKDNGIAIKTVKNRRLHTKLYLGHNDKETFILFGSSNISYAGLMENIELNTIETVPYDSKRATLFREWFENLWQIADEIDAELLQKIIEAASEAEEVLTLDDYTLRALLLSIRFLRETSKENLFYYQYEDAISVLERYNLGPKYTGVMLAHEVGLGKTIISAKVIKTLIEKVAAKKVLIATPASLCEQWQGELEDEKFGLSFEILDGQRLRNADRNLFQELDHIIVSIDFLKTQIDNYNIADIDWDLLVIDESHYLRNKDSQRFKEIKKLFYSAYFKMLLTATPIQNKDLDIFAQLSLIDESIKTLTERGVEDLDFETLRERNIIRRLRSDIKEFERIIPQRVVHPSNYIPLNESLRELYQKFKQFITQNCAYYPLIQELVSGFGYIVPFIQFVYLQQLCSSMEAFIASVRRLKDTIGELIDSGSVGINIQKYQQDFDGTDEAFNEFLEQYGEEQLERRGSKLYLKVKLSIEFPEVFFESVSEQEEISREGTAVSPILASQPDGEIAGGRFSGLRGRHLNDKFSQTQLQAKSSTCCVLKENPGFDCVVGNPPYVRQEELGKDKEFLSIYETYSGTADLYVYFMERAHYLLRQSGWFGMICSNKFMRSNYGKPLRTYLETKAQLNQIIDFGELPVFQDAAAMPAIIITQKGKIERQEFLFVQVKRLDFDSLTEEVRRVSERLGQEALTGENWTLASFAETQILAKMRIVGIPLGEYCQGKIQYGIKTGLNDAFIIDRVTHDKLISEDPKSAEIIKPLIVGDNVRKYHINFQERYLIWTYIGVAINQYPAILNYLKQHQDRMEKRWDRGNHWWELRACSYYEDFEKPKIVWGAFAIEPHTHQVKRFFPIPLP
ncbi:DEAD/DEAH box helicase [Candidatus Poribacteria bacterium]|nr:DEAD/DEAH box helicase [Candidatus Poribacteria bacterium]